MSKLSQEAAKEIAYNKIGIDLNHENRPIILDEYTLNFDWGYVFYYNGKKAIETNNDEYGYIGNAPILVDKLDGTAISIRSIGKILDSELEKYRKTKGYPETIKFPINQDISNLPLIEQVKILFRTGELIQIRKGIELIEKNQLLNLDLFKKIVFNNAFQDWSFEEQIAAQFSHESIILNSGIGEEFPGELKIFNDSTTLSFSGVKLKSITDDILQLPKLETIEIWYSELEEITPKIFDLKNLKEVGVFESKFGSQAEEIIKELKSKL